ncbi:MAG: CehA/McbA family metallohydrolase [Mobilitalea sp.]
MIVNSVPGTLFPAQELTIAQLLAGGDSYLSEYITIKNAVLGATSGSYTSVTDSTSSINIYKAAAFPAELVVGDTIDLYAAFSKYNTIYQLRNNSSADYIEVEPPIVDSIDTSITFPIASWAGTNVTVTAGNAIYADLDTANDSLDASAVLTHSTGNLPLLTLSSGKTIGYNNSPAGTYYQLSLNTAQYGNIGLSLKLRSSATGPKNFKVLYSTTGESGTFVEASATVFSITTKGVYESFSTTLPADANKCSNLIVRIQVADSVSVGNGTIASGGTNYMTEIKVIGNPAVSSTIAGYPTISPANTLTLMGQDITITSATKGASIYYTVNGGAEMLYDSANKPVITAFPYKISAYAVKDGLTNSIKISRTYTQAQVVAVTSSKNGGPVTLNTKILLNTETAGAALMYSTDDGATWLEYIAANGIVLNTLPITIKAKAVLAGYLDSEISTFAFTLKENVNYSVYFGQIHSHTTYSDGAGTCAEAFAYAKNIAEQIDFLAITDHSNSFDNPSTATILNGSMSTEWVEGHTLADSYTDNTFVGIYGYEMTWSNGLGHMNTYNTDGFQTREQAGYNTYSTALANYYAALKTDMDSISMFNHPGTTFGDFESFSHYDETIDGLISLIEVGNGEGAVGSSGYFASYEFYTQALDRGWHLAPTNNQDNHKGVWGDANTARTVILADSLTRENIYDALRNMRTYATEDNDLAINYTLNNEIMGTVMDTKPADVAIKVVVNDPTDTAIGNVEVIVNGGLSIASQIVADNDETVTFNLTPDYSYYYIRITESDGDIAVTAPVWISDVEAMGITSVTTSTALPIKDKAVTVTAKLYNNEIDPLTINSMEFSVDGTTIHTADLAAAGITAVTTGKTVSYSFDYTHAFVGAVSINAVVNATIDGVVKVFHSTLKLEYSDPAMVTNVIVDGTHYNDYVSGYYSGNMGNFTALAAGKMTQVTVVKDAITAEMLANCDLLVISAPAKKTSAGAYVPSHFEDSFIALVKTYTDNGGDIIVCGLADYQDTADSQSTTEINKLLAAIGATTKINSDEAYDTVNNGGSPYRLYLTNFNTSSEYMEGIAAGQVYSQYSGCTVLLDSTAVGAGTAEYLVKGHATTYSIDTKTFGGNYTEIPMGEAVILARESLASGSNVFVAGGVFMSNFEVAVTMDNAGTLPYCNRNICLNILASVKKEIAVSTVAETRAGVLGSVYAVEGIVTAGTTSGNAFFDTIYVQDATGGINIFPINSGNILVGQKVKVVGYLSSYLGDLELKVIEATVTDTSLNPLAATEVTTKEAMDYTVNGGKLIKIKGVVEDIIIKNSVVETIIIKDESDTAARVFIDGYIGYSDVNSVKLEDLFKVGDTISAVGLASYDTEGARIRVRDRSEILFVKAAPIIYETDISYAGGNCTTTLFATKDQGHITALVQIDAEALLLKAKAEASRRRPLPVIIPISNAAFEEEVKKADVVDVDITIILPTSVLNSDIINIKNIIMNSALLQAAGAGNKSITVSVKDENEKVMYSWSFAGTDLAKIVSLKDVNLSLSVNEPDKKFKNDRNIFNGKGIKDNNVLVIDFNHSGTLPAPADMKIYVGNAIDTSSKYGLKLNGNAYVYYYNSKTGKLETLPFGTECFIDAEGYLTFEIIHCSDYVVLPKKADKRIVATLLDQVKISIERERLSLRGNKNSAVITAELPDTLELVENLSDETLFDCIGAVTLTYTSSNLRAVKVDDAGKVTAVGRGIAIVSVKVRLYNDETKTIRYLITVK